MAIREVRTPRSETAEARMKSSDPKSVLPGAHEPPGITHKYQYNLECCKSGLHKAKIESILASYVYFTGPASGLHCYSNAVIQAT